MSSTRTHLLVVLLAVALVVPLSAPPVVAAGDATPTLAPGHHQPAGSAASNGPVALDEPTLPAQVDDRPADPSTEDTLGYVAGYWYDDPLPVDDREGAHVPDEELEAVVYRSMARVETIRNRTFDRTPDVDVITRDEFRGETDDLFGNVTENETVLENVRYEALFMVPRETDAVESYKELYGGSVAGYYEPGTDQIVLVSDDLEDVEVDEITLGHELVHAMQDQRVGLDGFDRSTTNADAATNGLVEGEASFVDQRYAERCGAEWTCLEPGTSSSGSDISSWGQYFSMYMPYDEGPEFVASVYEQGGWDAVDALYDEPPTSASEVIHAGVDRDPVGVDVDDRSSGEWHPLAVNGSVSRLTMGEGTIVSMFADGASERSVPSVVPTREFFTADQEGRIEDIHYAQPESDGWAGGEMVVYATDARSAEESGFVWQTEWTSETDARAFRDAYLDLLSLHDAEPVDGRQNTLRIDSDYPGAYVLAQDGTTVTIVRAPSTDAIPEIREGAAPDGDHTIEHAVFGTAADGGTATDDEPGAGAPIPGFGPIVALVALLGAAGVAKRID
ncbi:Hvo_1808 family surface protein [Halovivax cerinus]|uniref:Hvo_1808 family surface protein n=1 Tax=Halovivax cerinus TaxID=1487865 RepID=A0ABD5NT10_9EURY|nr:Hvo_1808 family surface protein [Halovivax cerinus]